MIISSESYRLDKFPVQQTVIPPAINPESPKNMDLSTREINRQCKKYKIPLDKPIITQVSRFDRLKDPAGVIKVFKKVKSKIDCRLVLCGSMAVDDPEGIKIYEQILSCAQKMIEKGDIIIFNIENDILVNVLQRISSVIIQKSLREGFGLTVSEALWKETPVVASNVGGIPLQIIDGENGFLLEPLDCGGFADRIIYLLEHPSKAEKIGKRGKEVVRGKFLITRLLADYIDLLNELI
jgi:trehalose synthase